jgi:hypothetical protein
MTPDARAQALATRRDELLARLPRKIASARSLADVDRELAVDEAITYTVLEHTEPVQYPVDLERVFWTACEFRVQKLVAGRGATIRGRFQRAPEEALADLAAPHDPAAAIERAEESALAAEFAATLGERERRALRVKYFSGTKEPLGYKKIAETLGISYAAARAADRAIRRKLERFAAVYTAGRLCPTREVDVSALAAGTADRRQARLARAHVAHCQHCRPVFAEQLRAMRSTTFEHKVASLLPAVAEAHQRGRLRGAWDAFADTIARPFGHDGAASAAQAAASGAGRGAGTAAALKLAAALCVAGAGAGACIQSGLLGGDPRDGEHPARLAQPAKPTPTPASTVGASATAVATPRSTATPRAKRSRRRSPRATQSGTGATSHEQTPASSAPADAAPNGASEFDPTYQPSQPAKPAPVPAAPGSGEFF